MKCPTPARAVLPTLLLAVALLLGGPAAAQAEVGYGYDDPRSMQISPVSFDVAPDGSVLYLADGTVYRIDTAGGVRPIAGGGRHRPTLSPAPALNADLSGAVRIATAPGGGVLIASFPNAQVYRVDSGMVRVAAGNGQPGPATAGPATQTSLGQPAGLAATGAQGFLIADLFAASVHEVSEDGMLETIAGGHGSGYGGDGGPAKAAQINAPYSVEPTAEGGVLIGDMGNSRIREIDPGGTITTVAGTGEPGYNGDGIPAKAAQISGPNQQNGTLIAGALDIEATPDGGFLFVDSGNERVRQVDPGGTITTVAGTGKGGYNGDGIQATDARMFPREVALTGDGGFLIMDRRRIRKVSADGKVTAFAGMPKPRACPEGPYSGIQGGPASEQLEGGPLRDLIRGESGADVLLGAGEADCLDGGPGDDLLTGNGNADSLVGEAGSDLLDGLDGPDRLAGNDGNDEIDGGDGPDRIKGGKDEDRIDGGTGNDRIKSGGDSAPDRVRCGPGRDEVIGSRIDRIAPNCEKVRVLPN